MKKLIGTILTILVLFSHSLAFGFGSCMPNGGTSSGGGGDNCTGTFGPTLTTGVDQSAELRQMLVIEVDISGCVGTRTISKISGYLKDVTTSSDRVIWVVYDSDAADNGGPAGEPWTKLYSSDPEFDAGNTAYEFLDSPAINVTTTSDTIWVGILPESTSVDWRYNAGTGQVRHKAQTTYAAPATWPYDIDNTSTAERTFNVTF